jgi:thioredoxin-related protein
MKDLVLTKFHSLISGLILALFVGQAFAGKIEAKPMHYDLPAWFKSSFLDIPADVDEARSAGKGLLIFFHLENCPFCAHLLKDNFTSGPDKERIQRNFDVVGIDVKGDLPVMWLDGKTWTEKELAKKLGVFATPAVLVLGPQREVVKKVMGYKKPDEFMALLPFNNK